MVHMDSYRNPLTPGVRHRPSELEVHTSLLEMARISCGRAIKGRNARPIMFLGLRGTGKTVLLNEIRINARKEGLLVSHVKSPEHEGLARLLYPEMREVMHSLSGVESAKEIVSRGLTGLQSFASTFKIDTRGAEIPAQPKPGLADSGDLEYDLLGLLAVIGKAAQAAGTGWVLFIDNVQYFSKEDLAALIAAIHRMSQERLPVLLIGAGLPHVARLTGEAKPYAERLFLYPSLDALGQA